MPLELQTLLYLVRLGIGCNPEPDFNFREVDWKVVVDLSFEQGVVAVAVDGLQKLYDAVPNLEFALDAQEMEELKYEWFGSVFETESRNKLVCGRAREIYDFFKDAGYRSCLLKGQGLALLYPFSEHRLSGDIDLWVDGDRTEVLNYVRSKGYKIGHVDSKHSDVEFFDDVSVEIHSLPSYSFDPICWRRLKKWSGRQIGIQADLYDRSVGFAYPSIDFNLVYVMHHIYRHIFNEGVGLRQVTDYACVLMHSDSSYRDEAWKMICALKMKRFAAGMMWVMKECYHIDEVLLLCEPCEKEGRFMLNEFLHGGSFGRFDKRHSLNYSGCVIARGLSQFKRNLTFLAHYPNEVLWSPFWKIWHWCWIKSHECSFGK